MKTTIGKRIQMLRKRHDFSQQDLADKLGISRQTIGKWEQDLSLPDLDMLLDMAEIFEVSLTTLVGVEAETNSISELYDQIQIVLANQQKANRSKNIFQIILILICVTSLGLTASMKVQLNNVQKQASQDSQTENVFMVNSHEHAMLCSFNINKLNLENSYLSSANMLNTKMNLENWTVFLDYSFSLKEYTPTTELYLEFIGSLNHTPITLPMTKSEENVYILKERIPLDDYYSVTLKITDGENVKVEDIITQNQCHYLSHAIESQIHLYVPLDDNDKLQLDTLVFDPSFLHLFAIHQFQHELHGDITIELYETSQDGLIQSITVPFDEKSVIELNKKLPLNKPVYVTPICNLTKPHDSIYTYRVGIFATADGEILYAPFTITDTSEQFPILISYNPYK